MPAIAEKVQLLIDTTTLKPGGSGGKRLIVERKEGGKIILRGELGRADAATSNNRMYPRALVEREVQRLGKEAKAQRLYGELDHPADGRTQFQRVSHRIRELTLEEDGRVMGEIEIIPTARGKDIGAIIEAGGAVGVSSRGTGTTHKRDDGVDVVNDDYTMITYDIVADPAHSGAYPEIFFESKDVPNLGRVVMPSKPAKNVSEADIDALVQSRVKQALDKHREKVRAEEQENLKAQFEQNLASQLEDIKKEALEAAKSEIMSDPKIADAKKRIEAIRDMVGQVEETEAIKERDAKIAELEAKVEELTQKFNESEEQRTNIAVTAKRSAIQRYLDKTERSVSNPDLFRDLIKGKIAEDDTAEVIKKKVEEALAVLKKFENRMAEKEDKVKDLSRQIKDEVKSEMGGLEGKLDNMQKENDALRDQTEKYKTAAEKGLEVGRKGYMEALKSEVAEAKTAGHPARHKIRRLVESANLNTRGEIEEFVENAIKAEGKNSALYDNVRSKVRRGNPAPLNEEGVERPSTMTKVGDDQKLFGYKVSEMQRLAGIRK